MTVSSEVSSFSYATDGATTSFPVPFYFLAASDLRVWLHNEASDSSTDLELGTDYDVTGAGQESGGAVVTRIAHPPGLTLRGERLVPITQETAYQRNDPFPERAHEKALDKLTMICQQLAAILGWGPGSRLRALLLGRDDIDGQGAYRARGNRIQDLGAPKNNTDAARKQDILDAVSGLSTDGSGQFVVERLADTDAPENGANMVAFRQKGANYTRTLSSRGKDSPHVRDYGPVSGDATDTLQKAAEAVAALPYSERCLEIDGDLYFDHLVVPDVQAFTITQRSMRSARLICTNLTDAPSITFLGEAPCWQNINLQMPLDFDFTASNKVGVLCKRPVGSTADMDGKFYGGRISRFGRGIENWGRGLSVGGMMILSACNECIYLEWPNVGDYVETDTIISSDSTGFRAFQFIGVRFHSFVSSGITNIGPNAHKINGGIIQGCLADIGRTIFDGYANNFLIDLGNSNLSARTVLNLRGGNHNRIRLGTLRGSDLSVPPRRADILVRIRGNGDGNYIGDGTLGECMNHAIDIRDGAQTNMTIAGIKFKNVCLEDAAYSPINVVGQGHDIKVRDIEMEGSLPVTAVVRCTDAGSSVEVQQDSIRISGYPAMPMIGTGCFSVRRSHVPGGQDRKETVGNGSPEGVVTGLAGDIYRQINATAGQVLWIKTSNTGSTGWRCSSAVPANSTGARPTAPVDRYVYWDTTINKLLVYDAGIGAYRDAMGTVS
ncbi:hypothetical protein [Bordetella trematum]|uniref:hypothetical protein n=1 Tax=Bordetella trematum TaxID=123899 RepID=UPI000D8D42CF|nr:hypothetical protein [Bordetella trematum]SPU49834.1 Uncharacterised protein [Bordetella trematum]VDH07580.1 Uncharacterised protein [Bordetella trematum]